MPPHDRLFKSLLRAFLPDLLRLVAPGVAERLRLGRITFLDKELLAGDGRRREADLVARIPLRDRGTLLVHVEVEARARRSMPGRLRAYAHRIQTLYDGQLLTILVNLRGGPPGIQRMHPEEEIPGLSSFQYIVFGLAGCDAADYLERPEPLAWALAAVMCSGSMSRAEHKLACLRRISAARLKQDQEICLVNFVEEYLLLTLEETEEYKILSARNPGRKGEAMWKPWSERMKDEGKKEGMRELLLHLLTQRFGPLTEAVRGQVEAITSPRRLTSLAGKVLTAQSLHELGFR